MKLLIVVEKTATGFSAFSPDLEGCVATGATRRDVEQRMREAVELHLTEMRRCGSNPAPPSSYVTFVEVAPLT